MPWSLSCWPSNRRRTRATSSRPSHPLTQDPEVSESQSPLLVATGSRSRTFGRVGGGGGSAQTLLHPISKVIKQKRVAFICLVLESLITRKYWIEKKLTFLTIQNHPFKLWQPTYLEIITLQKALLLFDSVLGGLGDYTNGDKFQTDVGILSEIKKLKSEVHLKNSTIDVLNQKVSSTGVACIGRVYIYYMQVLQRFIMYLVKQGLLLYIVVWNKAVHSFYRYPLGSVKTRTVGSMIWSAGVTRGWGQPQGRFNAWKLFLTLITYWKVYMNRSFLYKY